MVSKSSYILERRLFTLVEDGSGAMADGLGSERTRQKGKAPKWLTACLRPSPSMAPASKELRREEG